MELHSNRGRIKKINENIQLVMEKETLKKGYKADIKAFDNGNQYVLLVEKEYLDIRLVGAPASEIGKYGGDSDNWVWPRHTGDFSIFRIYSDVNNEPAEYSKDNVPFTPKDH